MTPCVSVLCHILLSKVRWFQILTRCSIQNFITHHDPSFLTEVSLGFPQSLSKISTPRQGLNNFLPNHIQLNHSSTRRYTVQTLAISRCRYQDETIFLVTLTHGAESFMRSHQSTIQELLNILRSLKVHYWNNASRKLTASSKQRYRNILNFLLKTIVSGRATSDPAHKASEHPVRYDDTIS